MPPLCFHLGVAREATLVLHHPVIERNVGSYAIGATLPDIQVVTSLTREETHFFDLETGNPVSGTKRIFEDHPGLADAKRLDDATQSLVAGYLSHLITDEIWILDMYRPLFGPASPLGKNGMGNMLDKLLQYELDRREREDRAAMECIRSSVLSWEPVDALGFIDKSLLLRWREFVGSATVREPDLGFFPHFARRYLLHRMRLDESQVEDFFHSLDASLAWTIAYVTPQRLVDYREKAITSSVHVATEYLGEPN